MNIGLLVQEFYSIEAISGMITGTQYSHFEPMRHSHCRWYQDFSGFRNEFIAKFASAIYDYTVLAVAAELRHCNQKASHYINGYYSSSLFRDQVYRDCTVYNAHDILTMGIKMFDTQRVGWTRGFGGEKWKEISKAGLVKGKVNDCVFIDHCVDLSHNSSVYFDKSAGIFSLSNIDHYKSFLDMKRVCKPRVLIRKKKGYVFNRLLWRAKNLSIIQGENRHRLFSSVYDETESSLLCYRPIQWGDQRLDCSAHNILYRDSICSDTRDERDGEYRREYEQCAA